MIYFKNQMKTVNIKQVKLLYAILRTTKEELDYVIENKQSYYYSFFKTKRDKRGNIIYENGQAKKRPINATKGRLNTFQKIITREILSKIPLPKNVKGSVKGSCNVANAGAHLGKHYKFK